MKIYNWLLGSAILLTVGFGHPAYAEMCANSHQDNTAHLKVLYQFSQIAEAPKQNNLNYMKNCETKNGKVIARSPTDIVDLVVPKEITDLVRNRVDNYRAKLQHSQRDRNGNIKPFTVGCSIERNDESILVRFSFKLLMRVIGEHAFFYLTGTEVTGAVVLRNSGEPIAIVAGTDLSRIPEIKANFNGEECVFPLVETTVNVLCEVLRYRRGSAYSALVEKNSSVAFSHKLQSLTMIGHSLGGSATQYVASNVPDQCKPGGDFKAFNAYAFPSPGLMDRGDAHRESMSIGGYLINGDWLLQKVFSDRFQRGRILIFTPPKPKMFCPGHFINEVQASICMCLQGGGTLEFPSGGLNNEEMFTNLRCENIFGRNSP